MNIKLNKVQGTTAMEDYIEDRLAQLNEQFGSGAIEEEEFMEKTLASSLIIDMEEALGLSLTDEQREELEEEVIYMY